MGNLKSFQTLIYNILEYGGHFFDGLLIVALVSTLFRPKLSFFVNRAGKLIVVAAVVLALSMTHIISDANSTIWSLTLLLSCFLYAALFFHGGIAMKLIFASLFCCTVIFADLVCSSGFALVLSMSGINISLKMLIQFFGRRVISKAIVYLLLRFLMKHSIDMSQAIPLPYITAMLLFSLCQVSFVIFFMEGQFIDSLPLISSFLVSLIVLILSLAIYHFFMAAVENFEEQCTALLHQRELEMQRDYLQFQEQADTDTRQFRHDMKAHLFCMSGLLKEHKYKELEEYMNSISQIDFLNATQRLCQNSSLNIVLNQKALQAKEAGIPMDIQVKLHDELPIDSASICAVMSNLLDNALEASARAKSPEILIRMKEVKGYLSILVENKVDYDILKENPQLTTSKADASCHGQGIKIIQRILKKCNGVSRIECTDEVFSFHILIPKES